MDEEKAKVDNFTAKTCNCHFGPKSTPCSTLFDREIIAKTRMNCREMNKAQLTLVVLANLEAHQHHHDQESSRTHIDYYFHGHKVCKDLFLFVHSVGSKQYKNLVSHFIENGLTLRTHGNTKHLLANTAPSESTETAITISGKHTISSSSMPSVIVPLGMSRERLVYFNSRCCKV